MHELSVLVKACDLAERAAIDNNVEHVKYIRFELGELTGYLPIFFHKFYPIVTDEKPVLRGSELIIDEVKGEGMCNECHSLYNIMKNEGRCPKCGSRNKTILSGTEFFVKDIGY
jgi:hydrogenase nickel incorporation protein HypA/HybF